MPVLLLSGASDPVGSEGKGVEAVSRQLKKLGMTNVTVQLFPNARHDIFHEKKSGNAESAITAVLNFMK